MPGPASSRAWLNGVLDEVCERLGFAARAGVANPVMRFEQDGIPVTVTAHGDSLTLEARPNGDQDAIGPLTFPAGWAKDTA